MDSFECYNATDLLDKGEYLQHSLPNAKLTIFKLKSHRSASITYSHLFLDANMSASEKPQVNKETHTWGRFMGAGIFTSAVECVHFDIWKYLANAWEHLTIKHLKTIRSVATS